MSGADARPTRSRRVASSARGADALVLLERAAAAGARLAGWTPDGAAYAKGGPLHGRARARHAVRAGLGLGLPRTREFDLLAWLRARGFLAPAPLAALVRWRAGRPCWQGLVTARVDGARDLAPVLAAADPAARAAACVTLGAELGRLHAAGFVHRDLYLRNLVWRADGEAARVGLLDTWRGGPVGPAAPGLRLVGRDAAYDLACLFVHLPALAEREAERALLDAYAVARGWTERRALRFVARAARLRPAAAARERRRGRRDGGEIPATWEPPTSLRAT